MAPAHPSLRQRLTRERRDRDKAGGWKRIRSNIYEMQALVADQEWLSARFQVFASAECVTDMEEKVRYVHHSVWPVTSGELARLYMRLHFGSNPRTFRSQVRTHMKRKAPLFCQPHMGNLAYIDLRHAYWEILKRYSFSTCYLPEQQRIIIPSGRFTLADEIDEDRRLRHALVGCLFTKEMHSYRYGVPTTNKIVGRYCQPSLYRICMDTLHAIATDVSRHFELWAWLTDAAVVSERDLEAVQAFLMDRWEFPTHVNARGHGVIYSVSSFRIGDERTDLSRWSLDQMNRKGTREPEPFKYMPRVNVTFWRNERKRVLARGL